MAKTSAKAAAAAATPASAPPPTPAPVAAAPAREAKETREPKETKEAKETKETKEAKEAAAKPKSTTKTVLFQKLSDSTKIPKKDIANLFDELTKIIKSELGKKGPGVFTLPGLLKLKRHEKKATRARKGRNPQTGEEIDIAAKPKRTVVRALPLKSLHEMVK